MGDLSNKRLLLNGIQSQHGGAANSMLLGPAPEDHYHVDSREALRLKVEQYSNGAIEISPHANSGRPSFDDQQLREACYPLRHCHVKDHHGGVYVPFTKGDIGGHTYSVGGQVNGNYAGVKASIRF